jgi:hypothetical protein
MNPTKTRLASPKRWALPELFAFGPIFVASHHLFGGNASVVTLLTGVLK